MKKSEKKILLNKVFSNILNDHRFSSYDDIREYKLKEATILIYKNIFKSYILTLNIGNNIVFKFGFLAILRLNIIGKTLRSLRFKNLIKKHKKRKMVFGKLKKIKPHKATFVNNTYIISSLVINNFWNNSWYFIQYSDYNYCHKLLTPLCIRDIDRKFMLIYFKLRYHHIQKFFNNRLSVKKKK